MSNPIYGPGFSLVSIHPVLSSAAAGAVARYVVVIWAVLMVITQGFPGGA